jgi:hypothetical protein
MRTYPLDVDARQLVRWIMAEHKGAPARFRTLAKYEVETRQLPVRKELHLGEEEREDLSETDTIASLEIAPQHASDGWLLTVVVEDEAGPHLLDKRPMAASGQQIDLETFYSEFIRPGRGIANVEAEAADEAAEARVAYLVGSVETNRHGT